VAKIGDGYLAKYKAKWRDVGRNTKIPKEEERIKKFEGGKRFRKKSKS
jgi:hypothetical protein